jgi:hypothetical protein
VYRQKFSVYFPPSAITAADFRPFVFPFELTRLEFLLFQPILIFYQLHDPLGFCDEKVLDSQISPVLQISYKYATAIYLI